MPMLLRALPFALALSGAALVPAAAQVPGPTELQRMLGNFGLLDIPPDESIEYRERAPLVVPPSTELPVPRSPQDVTRVLPDWPTDPEVAREQARRTFETLPLHVRRDDAFFEGRTLRPNELRRGTTPRRGPATAPTDTLGGQLAEGRERMSPDALGFKGWFEKEKPLVFTGEPARERLTDPPPGYQTPSPNAPYGVVEKDKPGTRISNPFDRLLTPGDPEGPK